MLAIHSQDTGKTSSNQFLYNFKLSDKNFLKAQDKSSESIWATAHDPPKKPKMSETAGNFRININAHQLSLITLVWAKYGKSWHDVTSLEFCWNYLKIAQPFSLVKCYNLYTHT